jgi:hypothetical protein
MNEEQWLACDDPFHILEFLGGKVTERKGRLFACACLRRARRLLTPRYLKAVEASENYADSQIETAELTRQEHEIFQLAARYFRRYRALPWTLVVQKQFVRTACIRVMATPLGEMLTFSRECWTVARSRGEADEKQRKELQARSDLLRDLFANPFHPLTVSCCVFSWHDNTIIRLAQTAYDERILPAGTLNNARLLIVADALEEAGCDDEQILRHLRNGGEHYRGCWAIDLLLGTK